MLADTCQSCHFNGHVTVPPLLTSTFEDQNVVEGESASISCAASGIPESAYVFRKVSNIHVLLTLIHC